MNREEITQCMRDGCTYQQVHQINNYIDTLEQQNKKYKEVNDKIKHYIEKECRIYGLSMPIDVATHLDNILGILKEVE